MDDNLVRKTATGYGWVPRFPRAEAFFEWAAEVNPMMTAPSLDMKGNFGGSPWNCVVARALGRPTSRPAFDAQQTRLGRVLTVVEAESVYNLDCDKGLEVDAETARWLAKQMGVVL